jgi:SAM-dependent methyltransferase
VSQADTRAGPAADDWEAHWTSFADAAERNPAQAFRRRVVLALLAAHGAPDRYLDIGAGQGDLAVAVADRWPDAEVAGIDLSGRGVEMATRKLPRGRFRQFDLLGGRPPLPGFERWATHATCSEVLEHVDEPEAFLVSARRWLGRGALLVVTVPGGPMSAFDRHVGHRSRGLRGPGVRRRRRSLLQPLPPDRDRPGLAPRHGCRRHAGTVVSRQGGDGDVPRTARHEPNPRPPGLAGLRSGEASRHDLDGTDGHGGHAPCA